MKLINGNKEFRIWPWLLLYFVTASTAWVVSHFISLADDEVSDIWIIDPQLLLLFLGTIFPAIFAEIVCWRWRPRNLGFLMQFAVRLTALAAMMTAYHFCYVRPFQYPITDSREWGVIVQFELLALIVQAVTVLVILGIVRFKERKLRDVARHADLEK